MTSAPGVSAHVTFSCSRKQGAISSLPVPAQRADTIALGDFSKCIIKNINLWFAFARNLGVGVTRMEEIILVTGRHLARSWTNVAFLEGQSGEQVSFGVITDTSAVDVEWQHSREDIRGVAFNCGPSGQVRLFTFSCLCRGCVWPQRIISEFTRKSVHICERVPCDAIYEDVTEGSRGSGTKAGWG
jgi:hypothetical protein